MNMCTIYFLIEL